MCLEIASLVIGLATFIAAVATLCWTRWGVMAVYDVYEQQKEDAENAEALRRRQEEIASVVRIRELLRKTYVRDGEKIKDPVKARDEEKLDYVHEIRMRLTGLNSSEAQLLREEIKRFIDKPNDYERPVDARDDLKRKCERFAWGDE